MAAQGEVIADVVAVQGELATDAGDGADVMAVARREQAAVVAQGEGIADVVAVQGELAADGGDGADVMAVARRE